MTLAEGRRIGLTTLRQIMEEKISSKNVEVVLITPENDEHGKEVNLGKMVDGQVKWYRNLRMVKTLSSPKTLSGPKFELYLLMFKNFNFRAARFHG
jgi:hypothetical protein